MMWKITTPHSISPSKQVSGMEYYILFRHTCIIYPVGITEKISSSQLEAQLYKLVPFSHYVQRKMYALLVHTTCTSPRIEKKSYLHTYHKYLEFKGLRDLRNINLSLRYLYAKLGDAEVLLRLWDPTSRVPCLSKVLVRAKFSSLLLPCEGSPNVPAHVGAHPIPKRSLSWTARESGPREHWRIYMKVLFSYADNIVSRKIKTHILGG